MTDELPEGKKNTGRMGFAGPIVTAGGLVFLGATNDNRFRAFDSRTGRELWSVQLEYEANAIPMTYEAENGKQYVAIMSAGEPSPGASRNGQALLVYALP
jgi:quinoprotein glucose dehydrogenase